MMSDVEAQSPLNADVLGALLAGEKLHAGKVWCLEAHTYRR